jgi:hypothetical protein
MGVVRGLLIGPGVIHAADEEPPQEATPSEGSVGATHPTYLQEGNAMKTSMRYQELAAVAIVYLAVVTGALAPATGEAAPTPPPSETPAKPPPKILRPPVVAPPPSLVQQPAITGGAFACMADAASRDLAASWIIDYARMTNQTCRSTCAQYGLAFAATQYGSSCFCGNTFGKYGEAALVSPPRSCNLGCAGNPNEVCGGEWANSLSLTGVTPPAPTDGGQCLVKAQGSYMTTGGAAGIYNGVELHRWEKVATISSTPTMKTYQFRYTMSVSGFMDQTGAGGQWRGTWGGKAMRMETWQAPLVTNPATGLPAFRLTTTPSFSTTVPYTGNLLNPLRPDPRVSATVSAFAQPQHLFSSGTSFVVPSSNGSTKQATGVTWIWNNPLGDATFTCSWNVSL